MKMYDPLKKDSFEMQFGFKSPNWRPKSTKEYVKIKDINFLFLIMFMKIGLQFVSHVYIILNQQEHVKTVVVL